MLAMNVVAHAFAAFMTANTLVSLTRLVRSHGCNTPARITIVR